MHEYQDYHKLICKFAWKFHNKTGIEFDEFLAEFNLVFVESDQGYEKSKKIPFSNYLCGNMVKRFVNIMTKRNTLKNRNVSYTDTPPNAACYELMDSILIRDSFFNSKNPVILSIAEIICSRELPATSLRIWLRKELFKMGFQHSQISEALSILKDTYSPEAI